MLNSLKHVGFMVAAFLLVNFITKTYINDPHFAGFILGLSVTWVSQLSPFNKE
jgi:hypothetical protein